MDRCTFCGQREPDGLVPWADQHLCWGCADLQLDLLALACAPSGATLGADGGETT